MNGERAFVERIRRRVPPPPDGQTWIGDDAAVLEGGLLAATDALADGVHFDLRWCTLEDVGWKAVAVNVSDIAAMGGTPTAALASLVVPAGVEGLADAVAGGIATAAEDLACPVVGGDTSTGASLVVTVTVLGSAPPDGAVLRSGARTGDALFVTGSLGGPLGALDRLREGEDPSGPGRERMRRPAPRVAEGRTAAGAGATAMIDVSDGLRTDLARLSEASGVGARLDGSVIPCAEGVGLDRALTGGDDYELCFTAPDAGAVARAFEAAGLDLPSRIGVVTPSPDVVIEVGGRVEPLGDEGWEHEIL